MQQPNRQNYKPQPRGGYVDHYYMKDYQVHIDDLLAAFRVICMQRPSCRDLASQGVLPVACGGNAATA